MHKCAVGLIDMGGGVQLFPGVGVQKLIPIETHITCDFPKGGSRPLSPSESAHGTGTCTSQETGTVYPGNEAT